MTIHYMEMCDFTSASKPVMKSAMGEREGEA